VGAAVSDCEAGRTAFLGGRWREPCQDRGPIRHQITSPGNDPLVLCDAHFQQVYDADLIDEPYIGQQEFERREHERLTR